MPVSGNCIAHFVSKLGIKTVVDNGAVWKIKCKK
jgi:hypothetical protein